MAAMNTKEAVRAVARRMNAYAKDCRELLLVHFPAVLAEAVAAGKKVHLAGLGTFYPRRGRKGLRVAFKPAKALLRALRQGQGQGEGAGGL